MKHATPAALDRLEPLLAKLRKHAGLKEKSRGTFYRASKAFLHFHEHGEDLFADIRLKEDFDRFPVTKSAEQRELLKMVEAALGQRISQSG